MPKPTTLASGQLNKSDQLDVELHRPATEPTFVLVRWPTAPSVASPDNFADLVAATFRVLAEARVTVKTHRCLGFGEPQNVLYTAQDRIRALAEVGGRPGPGAAGVAAVSAVHGAPPARPGGDPLGERVPLGNHRPQRDRRPLPDARLGVRRRGMGQDGQPAGDRPVPNHDHQAAAAALGRVDRRHRRVDLAARQGGCRPRTTGRPAYGLLRVVGRRRTPTRPTRRPGGSASPRWASPSPRTRSAPNLTGSTPMRSPARYLQPVARRAAHRRMAGDRRGRLAGVSRPALGDRRPARARRRRHPGPGLGLHRPPPAAARTA